MIKLWGNFSRSFLHILIPFIALFSLESCENGNILSSKNKDHFVSIKSSKELYVSADFNLDNQLVANRKLVNAWEKFHLVAVTDSIFYLNSFKKLILAVDTSREGMFIAKSTGISEKEKLKLIPLGHDQYKLSDYRGKFVSLAKNNTLLADKLYESEAEIFTISKIPKNQFSYFTFSQLLPLILGLIFIFISLILFQYRDEKKSSILFLLAGGFLVRLFVSLLGSYLNIWDEQFHALVAKNMMHDPFVPKLYANALIPFPTSAWYWAHVWLHKQPLFLWQMALSMKLFGVNVLAMRLPSIIMSTLVIYFIYQIGKITISKQAGYYGALLFSLAYFILELSAGHFHTDHNDVAFLFYVSASIWSWVEYENAEGRRKRNFLICIGLFSGCAVLVKWLTGLLVYSGWGLSILLLKDKRNKIKNFSDLSLAFLITLLTFLPWQIYIRLAFPAESSLEFQNTSSHFSEIIEGHGGDAWYHLNITNLLYGVNYIFVLIAVLALWPSLKKLVYKIAFFTFIFSLYIFFTLAATKMIAFTYCIVVLIYLSFGNIIDKFFLFYILNKEYFPKKIYHVIYTSLVLAFLLALNLRIESIQENHTVWRKNESDYFVYRERNTAIIKKLNHLIPDIKNYVIFNTQDEDKIPVMFFTDAVVAYSYIPNQKDFMDIKNKNYKIAVFDNGALPDYLLNDSKVIKIDLGYWQ